MAYADRWDALTVAVVWWMLTLGAFLAFLTVLLLVGLAGWLAS